MPGSARSAPPARREVRDGDPPTAAPAPASPRTLAATATFSLVLALGLAHVVAMHVMYDDAFISYRYAENLALGHGLAFNPGERVEGYSNFLWTLLMSVVVLLGGRPEDWGPRLSAAIALGTLLLVMRFARRRGLSALLAGGLVAASSCWATWATGGLETALFTGLVTAGALLLMEALEPPSGLDGRRWLASAAALGLACLTRPDGPLVAASAGAVVAGLASSGRVTWRAAGMWLGAVALIVLPHLAWRLGYYGRLLPNTFAVKPPGASRLVFGARYLGDAARDLGLWLLAVPMALGVLSRARTRGLSGADLAILAATAAPFAAYLATTGGDFMPVYRFVAPLVPLLTLAATAALQGVADRLGATRLKPAAIPLWALIALAYVGVNARESWRQQRIWNQGELVSVGWARQEVDDWLRIGDLLREVAAPTDTLATTAAGAVPYRSRLYTIDMLGLNAPDLSRFRRLESNRPGHMILYAERWLDEQPPQILLAHPLVHPTTASLGLSLDLRPEWRDRVLAHYDLVGLTLLGEPIRFVGCAIRKDCVERILEAGQRARKRMAAP